MHYITLAGRCTIGGVSVCIVPTPRTLKGSTHVGKKTFSYKKQGDLHSLKSTLKWVYIAEP
jgi:hypothetical protein